MAIGKLGGRRRSEPGLHARAAIQAPRVGIIALRCGKRLTLMSKGPRCAKPWPDSVGSRRRFEASVRDASADVRSLSGRPTDAQRPVLACTGGRVPRPARSARAAAGRGPASSRRVSPSKRWPSGRKYQPPRSLAMKARRVVAVDRFLDRAERERAGQALRQPEQRGDARAAGPRVLQQDPDLAAARWRSGAGRPATSGWSSRPGSSSRL